MIDKKILAGVLTAFGASFCCITPVLAVLAGSTGMASSFSWMEPFRPYLIAFTIIVLAYAWWDKLKPSKEGIDCACDPDDNGKVSFWHTKLFLAIVTIFSALMLSFPSWGDTLIKSNAPKIIYVNTASLKKVDIAIEGMTCQACEATVEKVASEILGVTSVKASTQNKNVLLQYDSSKTDISTIMSTIGETGYKAVSYKDKE